jgi:hypothetical protein
MTYWLDLFTGQTWQEFRDYGGSVSGFRKRMHNAVERIKPGDILLCYLTGVMRWVSALEVEDCSRDKKKIWQFDDFPERLSDRVERSEFVWSAFGEFNSTGDD